MTNSPSDTNSHYICRVALAVPLRRLFEYTTETLPSPPTIGARIIVPFRGRELIGVVVDTVTPELAEHKGTLKPVIKVLHDDSGLNSELLRILTWASDYYCHPIGETIISSLPPYLRKNQSLPEKEIWLHTHEGLGLGQNALKRAPKQQALHQYLLDNKTLDDENLKQYGFTRNTLKAMQEKGLITKTVASRTTTPESKQQRLQLLKEPPLTLTKEQQAAVDAIRLHTFNTYLLHGITGSGKTEIYLQLCASVLQSNQQALVLVPEIGLSPQTVARFRQRFSVSIAELHSGISEAQRAKNWLAAKNGDASIIIGTRLSALAPLKSLGLIIIDEEHDGAYIQQDGMRYSARDISIVRAKFNHAPIILGSATPSLESLRHAIDGNYTHLVLKHRASGMPLPTLTTIDLCGKQTEAGLCKEAFDAIDNCIQNEKQVLIFLNKRGYASMQLCHDCGWIAECRHCSANMTLHQTPKRLHCHHCDSKMRAYSHCPRCNSKNLQEHGVGTEQIESVLKQRFKGTPIIRVDRDNTKSAQSLKNSFDIIHKANAAILVGTQMIAKGHHFPKLQTVIIVNADQGLFNADFRSMEKMGQLIVQVVGRAGREKLPGQALIQTHQSDHPLLQCLLSKGYTTFARTILHERHNNRLPPYWYSASFRAESKRPENSIDILKLIKRYYMQYSTPNNLSQHHTQQQSYSIGPMPSNIERIQERYRFEFHVYSLNRIMLKSIIQNIINEVERHALSKRVRWSIDIDPSEA